MAAAFRAKTRMCPVLETQYVQNPRVDTSIRCYKPGKGFGCTIYPGGFVPVPQPYVLSVVYEGNSVLYGGEAIVGSTTVLPWAVFATSVFELYDNDPIIYGNLVSLTSQTTGIVYLYGSELPASSDSYTPIVTYPPP
jgi:hypothetical protein